METVPKTLLYKLAPGGLLLLPVVGNAKKLVQIQLTDEGFEETIIEDVFYVPMLQGLER